MKKQILAIIATVLLAVASTDASAQLKSREQMIKEREVLLSQAQKEVVKPAKKEAERLQEEEGWQSNTGNPLDKMIQEILVYEQINGLSDPKPYISASATGRAKNASIAKSEALHDAIEELSKLLASEVGSLVTRTLGEIETNVGSDEEAKIMDSSKQIALNTLKKIQPLLSVSRTFVPEKGLKNVPKDKRADVQVPSGMTEVRVTLYYDMYQAEFIVREEVKKTLKEEMKSNDDELRKLMGM